MIISKSLLYALVTMGFLILFIFIIFFYLIFKRYFETRREEKIQRYISEYSDIWYKYLIYGTAKERLIPTRANKTYLAIAIDRIFTNYTKTINNEDVINRMSHFAELNFQEYYRKMLKSKNWGVRMNILYRVIDFKLAFLIPDLEKTLRNNKCQSEEEYLLMLHAISLYNPNLFLKHFYHPEYLFREFEYKTILSYLEESYIEEFIDTFDSLPYNLQIALLDYLSFGTNMDHNYLQFYESLLQHDDEEIRIRTLKAISNFGTISRLDAYLPFATSQNWEERMMLAKLLLHADEDQALPVLQLLLCDSSWWVRKQAALTLSKLKNGIQILQETITAGHDEYAAEMAKEILKVG
ncbi:HEAT repeat domain-containing protein [Lysinibacillus sp. 54212]|uniref:HEAT repeat domain-containing protein n=1 Tax=Lysinibacillus sp. 54212 TaxID=3119829 RepID=UPI002FC74896